MIDDAKLLEGALSATARAHEGRRVGATGLADSTATGEALCTALRAQPPRGQAERGIASGHCESQPKMHIAPASPERRDLQQPANEPVGQIILRHAPLISSRRLRLDLLVPG